MPGLFSHLAQRIADPESTPRPVTRVAASYANEAPGIAGELRPGPSTALPRERTQARALEDPGKRDASEGQLARTGAVVQATAPREDQTGRRAPAIDADRSGVARERPAPYAIRADQSEVTRPRELANRSESARPDTFRSELRASHAALESDPQSRGRELLSLQRRLQSPPTSQTSAGAPTVHVSIGRIEIRTQRVERAEPATVAATASSRISLDDYLKRTPGNSS